MKRAIKQGQTQRWRMPFQVEGQEATETCGREEARREDVKGDLSGQREEQGQRQTPGGFQKQVGVVGRDAGSEGKMRAGT